MEPFAGGLSGAICDDPELPVVLFGQGLGALIAYEVAQRLHDCPDVDLRALVVAGHPAPRYGGTVVPRPGVPEDAALRAYGEIARTYRHREAARLAIAVHVHGGVPDSTAPPDALAAWQEHAVGEFVLRLHPGGHFFLTEPGHAAVPAALSALLSRYTYEKREQPMFEDDDREYVVVRNDENDYSIWPRDRDAPAGWHRLDVTGRKAECLEHIGRVWTGGRSGHLG
jgi:MbtH protein